MIESWLRIENMLLWLRMGGDMGKYCERERMYVDRNFDCEGCTICKGADDGK